jgi:hypothetical protein
MDTDQLDLSHAFDHCFDGEPEGPPVALYVARGRQHVGRRRAGAAVAMVAVVAAVGTGVAVVGSESEPEPSGVQVSSPGSTTPSPTIQTEYDFPEDDQDLARIHGYAVDGLGQLILGAGVDVVERVDLPEGVGYAQRSYGLDLIRDGEEIWVYAPWNESVDGVASSPGDQVVSPVAGTTFSAWLDDVVAAQVPPLDDPAAELATVQLGEAFGALDVDSRGRISLNPGAEIVEQVDNPMGLAAPYRSTALRVTFKDVESWWLVTPGVAAPFISSGAETFTEWWQARRDQGVTFSASGPMPPIAKIVDGMPEVLPDVTVLRRVSNPLGLAAPARSVAYWARLSDGSEWWYLWELGPSGYFGAQVNRAAGDGYTSFDDWLADQSSQAAW